MLRADIRQFLIVRRSVNEDICAVDPTLRADILSTTLTSGTFTAIENSLIITQLEYVQSVNVVCCDKQKENWQSDAGLTFHSA